MLATAVSQLEPGRQPLRLRPLRPRPLADRRRQGGRLRRPGGRRARQRGPFPARYESLETDAEFRSAGVEKDKDAAKSVYVADLRFTQPGRYEVLGRRPPGRPVRGGHARGRPADGQAERQGARGGGARRRAISTPTKASVSGNLSSIDTRVPPSTMHDEDFADVVGKKPTVLLFATPALCQSRVCGPVVDIAEQVKARGARGAAFIHQEIYRDNEVEKGLRPQVLKWNLQSEPWLFVIDKNGRISARIEGPFSVNELERALNKVTGA